MGPSPTPTRCNGKEVTLALACGGGSSYSLLPPTIDGMQLWLQPGVGAKAQPPWGNPRSISLWPGSEAAPQLFLGWLSVQPALLLAAAHRQVPTPSDGLEESIRLPPPPPLGHPSALDLKRRGASVNG